MTTSRRKETKQRIATMNGTEINASRRKRQEKFSVMPTAESVLKSLGGNRILVGITRFQYPEFDTGAALRIVEAIGKARSPKFTIDNDNRFAYENFIRWCHGDPSMECIDPGTKSIVNGRLKRGIYIAGNTGTGKSWCLEIMLAYCIACGFKIKFVDDSVPRQLSWNNCRSDEICDAFAATGTLNVYKRLSIIGLQDLGSEPQESVYMGNRLDAIRQLIEYRGDRTDEITFITSNMKINGDKLAKRYGDRVASRLCEMCNYLEIRGTDRRKI